MPLMMDDDIEVDMDDLFGDAAGLSLPAQPPPKELFQRVDELRGSGCCQTIAWSRWGSIASVSPTGAGLEFRNLRCHPRDGAWDLSEATLLPQVAPTLDGGPLQHLCWSPNGCDLAAIDTTGRISILTIGTFLNKPNLARSSQMDSTEDLHAIVGAYWLNLLPNQQRPPVVHSVAVKVDQEYRFEFSQAVSFGPCHPNPQKSALVCLTTSGILRLLWPQSDSKWYETNLEVESISSSDDLITHASIGADKNNTLLLAFVTTSKQLRTARVVIKWGNKPTDKPQNPAQVTVNPSITIRHLAVTNWMEGMTGDGTDVSRIPSSMAAISLLEIFAPSPDGPGGQATLPTIMTIRSHLPASPSHYNQETYSVIDRWELYESTQAVHPAFEELSSRRNSVGSQPGSSFFLRKLDGFTVNKVAISITAISLDRILCFAYSDGSIEYRDRSSMAEMFTEGGLERFTHMSQIGFSYNDDDPCLQVAPSPTYHSITQIGCDGKIKWKTFGYHMGDIGLSFDDPQYAAIVAGLTMSCSVAVMGSINYDDLLAIATKYTTQSNFAYDWLSGVSRLLKFHVDYTEEQHHDTLIRNPSVQICLGIQNSLGYKGDGRRRSFGANVAWISLQIRNCVVLMTMAANMKIPDAELQKKISGLEDAEAIRMLAGSVHWCLDLMSWLIDSLIHPDDTTIFRSFFTNEGVDLQDLNSRLLASENVALHLLLSSTTRGFLTAICRRLSHLDYTARRAMQTAAQAQSASQGQVPQLLISNPLRASYTAIATLTSISIIQIRTFEAFLTSISTSVKEAYTAAGLPSSAAQQNPAPRTASQSRNSLEQIMLFGGPLPSALIPAMTTIVTSLLPALRASIDPSKLFFHDFSLLALSPDPKADTVAHTIDIFQRIPITLGREPDPAAGGILAPVPAGQKGRRWRRCARCAAVMEDISSSKPAVQFLIMQQRRCFCGGNWDVIGGKQVVA